MNLRKLGTGMLAALSLTANAASEASEALWAFVERVETAIPFSSASVESAINHELKRMPAAEDDLGIHYIAHDVPVADGLVIWDLHLRFADNADDAFSEVIIFGPRYPELKECVQEKDIKDHLVPSFREELIAGSEHLPALRAWVARRALAEMAVHVQPDTGCVQSITIMTKNLPG